MKKIKFLLAAALLLSVVGLSQAQGKIAYLNSSEITGSLPEMDSVSIKLEKFQSELVETFEEMKAEYERKLYEYTSKGSEWSEVMQTQKGKEIQALQESIQLFQESAEQDMQIKYQELISPLTDKVREAINAVAKEHGYTYVLDVVSGALVYVDENNGINAGPLVKAKLGIKE